MMFQVILFHSHYGISSQKKQKWMNSLRRKNVKSIEFIWTHHRSPLAMVLLLPGESQTLTAPTKSNRKEREVSKCIFAALKWIFGLWYLDDWCVDCVEIWRYGEVFAGHYWFYWWMVDKNGLGVIEDALVGLGRFYAYSIYGSLLLLCAVFGYRSLSSKAHIATSRLVQHVDWSVHG